MTNTASNQSESWDLSPAECFKLIKKHRRMIVIPTLICTALALVFALVMSKKWEASQALVVRQEVNAANSKTPGKFADLYEMRTFQETILELAKSRQVIAETLKNVELASGSVADEPTDREVDKFRKWMSMSPPGGAEFGKTEVFYLSVKDKNRERAIQLVSQLCHQIDVRLRQLREEQAESLKTELNQQVELAGDAHDVQTRRLAEFEASVGADLGELRMLNASFSGQSDLRQQAIGLEAESRQAVLQVRTAEQLVKSLQQAQSNPDHLIAMPNSLLTSQPTLRQLKDGLVAAQLRASNLNSSRTESHPQVIAAKEAVERIRGDLHDELQVAIRGVQVELELGQQRAASLSKKSIGIQNRLSRLAELRAEYANLVSAADNSRQVLDQARKQLGEVSAAQAAAKNVSLVMALDKPETGPNPVSIARSSVVMLGAIGGFALGLGGLFLTVNPVPSNSSASQEVPTQAQEQNVKYTFPTGVSPSVAAKVAEVIAATRTNVSSNLHSPSSN